MAYDFNGTNQYLSTVSAPASGTPMTLACWARRTGSIAFDYALMAVGEAAGTHRNQVQLNQLTSYGVRLVHIGSNGQAAQTSSAGTTLNTWHHAAGVFASNSSRTPYTDGVAGAETTTNIGTQNAANYVNVGTRTANNAQVAYFLGDIAEVGIWNTALTAAEIASLAKGMTCDKVRPQSLVFYAPLVRDLQDVRGGLTITNNNTATVANHPRVYA
jgi:hypothetical protein